MQMGEKSLSTISLSVLTFNLLGVPFTATHKVRNFLQLSKHLVARMKVIAIKLNESSADILFLQEVHMGVIFSLLKRRLTNYPYVAFVNTRRKAKGGLVIFSKYPVEYATFTNFRERGPLKSKAVVSHIAKSGILVVKLQEMHVVCFNVYLNGDFHHIWNESSLFHTTQLSQVTQLATLISFFKKLNNVCIIGGDLNFPRTSSNYSQFKKLISVEDGFEQSNKPTYREEFLPKDIAAQALDYLLVSAETGVSVKNPQYLFEEKELVKPRREIYLSDHIGLQLTVEIPVSLVKK